MKLGEFFSFETESIELKEFCLKIGCESIFEQCEIIEIMRSGDISDALHNLILKNLQLYINLIIPKYMACFVNANIQGEIYLGIDDFGIISGIPTKNGITREQINVMLKDCFQYIKPEGDIIPENMVEFEIIDIETPHYTFFEDTANKLYKNYKKYQRKWKKRYKKYMISHSNWLDRLAVYHTKLTILSNSEKTRKDLTKYVIKNGANKNIIDLFQSDKQIHIPYGEISQSLKIDKTTPFYWIIRFQEKHVRRVHKERPPKPIQNTPVTPDIILNRLSNMNYKFLKNQNVTFQIIKFTIKKYTGDNCVYFRSFVGRDKSKMIKRKRALLKDIYPGCIP